MSSPEELSPSYSWYPRDWRGSSRVRDMSWKERGFYRECLDWAWVMDGLPSDLEEIRRLCGASKTEFPKLWIAAKRMFDLTEDGRYRNERQERERLKKEIFRRRAEDGGKAKAVKEAARKQALSSALVVGPESGSSGLQSAECREQRAESRVLAPVGVPTALQRAMTLESDDVAERAGRLVERYGELYAEHRRGARLRPQPALDWKDACDLVKVWTDARLEKLAAVILTTDDTYITSTDRGFKIFAMKASWADDRLTQWEHEHGQKVTA